ncbi:MAG TPA: hypothetical protein VIJ15_05470, partial [Dermatophilaceae bacterium]
MTNEAIPDHPTVVAVVVTWNRLKLMTERVTMLGLQTRRPDVVVDNASTDGSVEVARTQFP